MHGDDHLGRKPFPADARDPQRTTGCPRESGKPVSAGRSPVEVRAGCLYPPPSAPFVRRV